MPRKKGHILITGSPGSGKTTLITTLAERLSGKKAGFVTMETREGKRRTGFEIVTFSGERAPLAVRSRGGSPRVGSYRVLVNNVDDVAVPSISEDADFIIIDEIGKMECLSRGFKAAVIRALEGDGRVIGTVAKKGENFIKEVKERADVILFDITRENRDTILETLLRELG